MNMSFSEKELFFYTYFFENDSDSLLFTKESLASIQIVPLNKIPKTSTIYG